MRIQPAPKPPTKRPAPSPLDPPGKKDKWWDPKPREGTEANFAETDLIQSCSNAAIEGFYMLGPVGAAVNASSTFAGNHLAFASGNKYLGALGGAGAGALLTAGLGMALKGQVDHTAVATGSLVGAYSVLRGDRAAKFRDAGAFGLFFSVPFSGGAKAGIGLASTLAVEVQHEGKRALLASGLGAAAGVATSLMGPVGLVDTLASLVSRSSWGSGLNPELTRLVVAGAMGGLSATLGAVAGPRIGQAMRNAEQDAGNKLSEQERPKPGKFGVTANQIKGSLVGSLVRQGVNAVALGKLDLSNLTGSALNIGTGIGIDAGMGIYQKYLINKNLEREKQE